MPPSPDLEANWQRLRGAAERVVEAADRLDDAGGLRRLAPTMSPTARRKALETLQAARDCLDGQIHLLENGRRVAPPKRSPGGPVRRSTPTPDPRPIPRPGARRP